MQTFGVLLLIVGGVTYGYGWKLHSDGDKDNKVAVVGLLLVGLGFGLLSAAGW